MRKFVSWSMLAVLFLQQLQADPNLAISKFLTNKNFKSAGISIAIAEPSSGRVFASFNPYLNLTPASTLKLVTTATALELFGADFRFETKVLISGEVSGDKLDGDLYIKGSGDPTIGSEFSLQNKNAFFEMIYLSLSKKGIKEISGKIVGDESAYNSEIIPAKIPWEDMGNYYAAGVSALNFGDNMYRLSMKTGVAGSTPALIDVQPTIKGLTFKNYLVAKSGNKDSAFLYGMPYINERSIYGTAPAKKANFVIKGDVPDPALFMVEELEKYLVSKGIKVTGVTTTRLLALAKMTKKNNLQEICSYTSDPLSHIVKITNKHSYNFYAESLLRLIASKYSKEASLPAGIAALKSFWSSKNMETSFLMYDGSGLSPANRVSAQFMVQIIDFMVNRSQNADTFVSSLAIAGVDGTLKSFAVTGGDNVKVMAKSGSFDGVLSYCGIVEQKRHKYFFCVIVNAFTCPTSEVKKAIEHLLKDL